jgi:hypothetical protein
MMVMRVAIGGEAHILGQRIFPVGGREYQEYSVIFAK